MINNPKVTIVTAVYKKEVLIHTCIASVLSQTLTDFELILVDDGSPDKCPQICDDYAQKDSRIKVIHRENGGHAVAVNTGIIHAKGTYITILDADDYFCDKEALEQMFDIATQYDSDIVLSDFLGVWSAKNIPKIVKGTGIEVLDYLISDDIYHPTTRSKLIKKETFKNNLFKDLICDDEDWTPKTFYKAKKVAIYPKKIYYRTIPSDSVTQIETEENFFRKAYDKALTTGVLINFFEKENLSLSQKQNMYKRFIALYLSSLYIYANKLETPELKEKLLVMLEANKHVLKSSKYYKNNKHHFIAWIVKLFGLKPALFVFKFI